MADWKKILSRGNVEDRRSFGPVAAGGIGLGAIALYLVVNLLTDGQVNIPIETLNQLITPNQPAVDTSQYAGEDSYEVFVSTILGSNNDMWSSLLAKENIEYVEPRLVLFRTATESACGGATSDVGPHYCPLDETIYLDETFFDELSTRFGADNGDVAQAYIISHEVGHHIQNLLGTLEAVSQKAEQDTSGANDLSVRLELQADCYAGLWSRTVGEIGLLSPGEINEATSAASAVGDDRIQASVTGRINPESWTHGSSEQRVSWFTKGYGSDGSLNVCDTFNSDIQ